MVRALAEFIMRGRLQAVSIALLGSVLPLLTQVTPGLVTLRKGWQEGLIVTLWAVLPALVALWLGDFGLAQVLASVAVVCVTYIVAGVLRSTVSWSAVLSVIVGLSALFALIIGLGIGGVAEELEAFFFKLLSSAEGEGDSELIAQLSKWSDIRAAGLIAMWIGLSSVMGIVVARWWQAILYNPGGFRSEFYQIRLAVPLTMFSGGATAYCLMSGPDYQFWAELFRLPLLLIGLAIVHCGIAKRRLGLFAIVAAYFALIAIPVAGLLVILLGLTDAWIDYRKRFNLLPPDVAAVSK